MSHIEYQMVTSINFFLKKTAKATGVAAEAINNVRTVKAFAMEESESRYTIALIISILTHYLINKKPLRQRIGEIRRFEH